MIGDIQKALGSLLVVILLSGCAGGSDQAQALSGTGIITDDLFAMKAQMKEKFGDEKLPLYSVRWTNRNTVEVAFGRLGNLSGHLNVYTFKRTAAGWVLVPDALYSIDG